MTIRIAIMDNIEELSNHTNQQSIQHRHKEMKCDMLTLVWHLHFFLADDGVVEHYIQTNIQKFDYVMHDNPEKIKLYYSRYNSSIMHLPDMMYKLIYECKMKIRDRTVRFEHTKS